MSEASSGVLRGSPCLQTAVVGLGPFAGVNAHGASSDHHRRGAGATPTTSVAASRCLGQRPGAQATALTTSCRGLRPSDPTGGLRPPGPPGLAMAWLLATAPPCALPWNHLLNARGWRAQGAGTSETSSGVLRGPPCPQTAVLGLGPLAGVHAHSATSEHLRRGARPIPSKCAWEPRHHRLAHRALKPRPG